VVVSVEGNVLPRTWFYAFMIYANVIYILLDERRRSFGSLWQTICSLMCEATPTFLLFNSLLTLQLLSCSSDLFQIFYSSPLNPCGSIHPLPFFSFSPTLQLLSHSNDSPTFSNLVVHFLLFTFNLRLLQRTAGTLFVAAAGTGRTIIKNSWTVTTLAL
jgi:hypothetical protein